MPDEAKCPRCGDAHAIIACPNVKVIELEHGGDFNSIRRIEFLTPADCPEPARAPEEPPPQEPDYPRRKAAG